MPTSRFAVFFFLVVFQGLHHVACGKLINCPGVNQTLKFWFFVSKNGVRSQGVHLLLLLCLTLTAEIINFLLIAEFLRNHWVLINCFCTASNTQWSVVKLRKSEKNSRFPFKRFQFHSKLSWNELSFTIMNFLTRNPKNEHYLFVPF